MDITPVAIINIHLNGMQDVGPFAYAESHISPYFPRERFLALNLPFSFIGDGIDTYTANLGRIMQNL
jgi:hypothetical protein